MRKDREIAGRFRAIKKYVAHLRVCAFNDFIEGFKESPESEILDRIKLLLEKDYGELEKPILKREFTIDFCNRKTAFQIIGLFRAISQIESAVYGNRLDFLPILNNPAHRLSSAAIAYN